MKKCFLHIGNFKTGSTSLQSFLFLNKEELKRENFKVIKEKNFFKNTIHNQKLFKYFDKQNFKKIKDYFPKKKDNSNLILSSEFFSCLSYDQGKILFIKKTILQLGFQPIIIFYFRSDDSYLYSLYAQQLTQRHNIKIDSVLQGTSETIKIRLVREVDIEGEDESIDKDFAKLGVNQSAKNVDNHQPSSRKYPFNEWKKENVGILTNTSNSTLWQGVRVPNLVY